MLFIKVKIPKNHFFYFFLKKSIELYYNKPDTTSPPNLKRNIYKNFKIMVV
jgi:hypothetical protein